MMKCAVSTGAAAFELVTASQELNSYKSGAWLDNVSTVHIHI